MVSFCFTDDVDLAFTPQILNEYVREGKWIILALLYNQDDFNYWQSFLQWLNELAYYEEDEALQQQLNATPFDRVSEAIPYRVDPITSALIAKERNDVVYQNIVQLFHYFTEYRLPFLEETLRNQNAALLTQYDMESPEMSNTK